MMRLVLALLVAYAAHVAPAHAETSAVSATGFVSSFREEVKAAPPDVWNAMVQIPRWWSSEHTWSGDAANMSLDLQAGGCWCERWGNGNSVQHGQVVFVQSGRVIRLFATLGPLQDLAVNGVLTLVTSAQDGKTFLRMSYRVSGSADAGLEKLAPVVDQVLGIQYQRLKSMVETGRTQ